MIPHRSSRAAGAVLFVALLCAALIFPGGVLSQEASPEAASPPPPLVQDAAGRVIPLEDARVPPGTPNRANLAPEASGDYRVDALLSGYQWPGSWSLITYSFYADSVFGGNYYGPETVSEVSEAVKANVRQIMDWYAALMDVSLVEVSETPSNIGHIRFMRSSGQGYAYAYYPTYTELFALPGDVHLSPDYDRLGDTNGFQHPAGMHGYTALIHEIGHALGLKHPHDLPPTLPAAEDNDSYTLMSYTWPSPYRPATPMPYDILALHYLYGARDKNPNADAYVFTSRGADQYVLAGTTWQVTPYALTQTLWDSGGANTLDMTHLPASASGYRLDLRGGGWLTTGADYGGTHFMRGTALAYGVRIHNLISSGSADAITAGAEAIRFAGYGRTRATGADVIYGAKATDTLDLRDYVPGEVTLTRQGDDLALGLGGAGSVKIVGYYAGHAPTILYTPAVQLYVPLVKR